jgi:hypothetical protein
MLISALLLLTYSLGFAHNFVPHHHDTETQVHEHAHQNEAHEHHHHKSSAHKHQAHEHISHGDHYDEGFYDLLIRFLHDVEHHDAKCDPLYFVPVKRNTILSQTALQLTLFNTLLGLTTEFDKFESRAYFTGGSLFFYPSYSTPYSPLRGPPTPEC